MAPCLNVPSTAIVSTTLSRLKRLRLSIIIIYVTLNYGPYGLSLSHAAGPQEAARAAVLVLQSIF